MSSPYFNPMTYFTGVSVGYCFLTMMFQEMFVSVVSAAIVFPVTIFVILVFRTSNSRTEGNDVTPSDSDDYNDNYDDVQEANRDLDDMSLILGELNSNIPGLPNIMSQKESLRTQKATPDFFNIYCSTPSKD